MVVLACAIALALSCFASLFWGVSGGELDQQIFWILRFPRALAAISVGGGLAVAGTLIQAGLGNPLADPFTLGVSSAAALGGVVGLYLFPENFYASSFAAFVFAIIALVSLLIWLRNRFSNTTEILLVGVLSGLFFSAIATFIQALGDPSNWLNAMNWLLGSIGTFQITEAVGSLILVVLITLASFFLWKPLDLLSVNEVTAKSSGVDVVFYRKLIFVLVSLLTAICVSLSGIIGFVGFIIPHALRLMGVTSHKRLIPCSFLLGGSLLLFSDMLARFIIPSTELPVGVVMAMIGTPSFLALIRKSQR